MYASLVIPVYHDAEPLTRTLTALPPGTVEIVVAATADDRAALAGLRAARPDVHWIEAPKGRAAQMNAGAHAASGDWLLFLHADTRLPDGWMRALREAERDPRVAIGCFRFALDSSSRWARVIEWGVRVRVACFALPYGDQALFVRRDRFHAEGGYRDLPIMEDVDLVKRFTRLGRLYCAPDQAVTSARKWERDGWVSRTLTHLRLIALYFLGVPPDRLARSI